MAAGGEKDGEAGDGNADASAAQIYRKEQLSASDQEEREVARQRAILLDMESGRVANQFHQIC